MIVLIISVQVNSNEKWFFFDKYKILICLYTLNITVFDDFKLLYSENLSCYINILHIYFCHKIYYSLCKTPSKTTKKWLRVKYN